MREITRVGVDLAKPDTKCSASAQKPVSLERLLVQSHGSAKRALLLSHFYYGIGLLLEPGSLKLGITRR